MNVNKVKTLTAEIVSAMQHANGAKGDVKKDRSKVAPKNSMRKKLRMKSPQGLTAWAQRTRS